MAANPGRPEVPGRRWSGALLVLVALVALWAGGCGTPVSFIHPSFDFGYTERVAVLPFLNISNDDLADERIQSLFLMELLDADVLAVIDSRESAAALAKFRIDPNRALTTEQIIDIGEELGVQAVFTGVVEEYGLSRSDRTRGPEVTAVFEMVETETGSVVWRAQAHQTGGSFWKRLFGKTADDPYTVSRRLVRKALRTLL